MAIVDNVLIVKGIEYVRNGDIKSLLFGGAYIFLSSAHSYKDTLKYNLARITHHRNLRAKIVVNNYNMEIDLRDKGISKELYLYKIREHFSTEYMKSFIDDNDIIIDVGSNIGYYALLESGLAQNGKIYALEPIPSNFSTLKNNVYINSCNNIYTFPFAIGDHNSSKKMYIYDKCNWCSFNKSTESEKLIIGEVDVATLTLDRFIDLYMECNPTIIRMDVEGYEYEILTSSQIIYSDVSPLKLSIELHPHLISKEKMNRVLNILKQNNFRVKAAFFDPKPEDYKHIRILNRIRRKLGYPEFGYIGDSYDELQKILDKKYYCPIVFFER